MIATSISYYLSLPKGGISYFSLATPPFLQDVCLAACRIFHRHDVTLVSHVYHGKLLVALTNFPKLHLATWKSCRGSESASTTSLFDQFVSLHGKSVSVRYPFLSRFWRFGLPGHETIDGGQLLKSWVEVCCELLPRLRC